MTIYVLNEVSVYSGHVHTFGYFDSVEKAEEAKKAILLEYSKEGYEDFKRDPDRYRIEKFAEMNKMSFDATRMLKITVEKQF